MSHTLLIDIGNTRVKWYVDEPNLPITMDTIPQAISHHDADWLAHIEQSWSHQSVSPTECRISNVAHEDVFKQIQSLVTRVFPQCTTYRIQPQGQAHGFTLAYPTPTQMGSDRYAQLLGAQTIESEHTHLVISFGTAVTVDGVQAHGQHIGGLILSSTTLMRKSLHQYTAKLPLDGGAVCQTQAPNTTTDALATAASFAIVGAIHTFIERYLPDQKLHVILCGGGAADFESQLTHPQITHTCTVPALCLLGLKYWTPPH